MPERTLRRLRIIKTCNLYLSAIASGMAMSVTGPTLLDLQNVVHTDTKHIGFIYTGRSSGYLAGSLIGGALFDMTPRKQFIMTALNLLISVSLFAIPWSRSIEVITVWMVLNGISMGALDTGLNVCCLNLWGKDSAPFYQALHFTYGFGGLVAPLIAAPFLGDYHQGRAISVNISSSVIYETVLEPNLLEPSNVTNSLSIISNIPSVAYAYAILGVFALFVTVLFLVVCIIAPFDDNGQQNQSSQVKKRSATFIAVVVSLTFLLLFVETGIEIGFAQMVATYAVKGPLALSPMIGSYMTSVYWGALTVSRFSSIFLAIRFSNLSLIVFDLALASAGAVVLMLFVNEWALWLATVLLGFGIASLFPTAISWLEEYITITNKILGLFATGAAFGEMVIPYTISHFIEDIPEVLSYNVLVTCALSILLTVILYLILRKKEKKYVSQEGISNADCRVNTIG